MSHICSVLKNPSGRSLTVCAHFLRAVQRVQNARHFLAEGQVVYSVGEVVSCGLIGTLLVRLHPKLYDAKRTSLHNRCSVEINNLLLLSYLQITLQAACFTCKQRQIFPLG